MSVHSPVQHSPVPASSAAASFLRPHRLAALAGCFMVISTAWFLAFLIPEPSRDVLIGPRSHWSERCAFIVVVLVTCAAGRHALSLRPGPLAVAMLGVSAPIGGFLTFMIGPGLVAGEFDFHALDPRTLGFLWQLILFYLTSCWYVILVLGPATAFVLSKTLARDRRANDAADDDQQRVGDASGSIEPAGVR